MSNESIYILIENLLNHAVVNLDLQKEDVIYTRNQIYDLLNLDGINHLEPQALLTDFNDLLDSILAYALENQLINADFTQHLASKLMGTVSLKPSQISIFFNHFNSKKDATNWFYNYCVNNRYIDKRAIDKNIMWLTTNTLHPLKITINLSKPEKSNEDIKRLSGIKKNAYPQSLLALENVGFKGSLLHPARHNIRVIPIVLNNEEWFFQYSPYGYFSEHLIAVNKNYTKMIVNDATIDKLFDFVETFDHYFIGSNASLPIIGGSILDHEHYQGGLEKLPLFYAKVKSSFEHEYYPNTTISILDWYNSALRLESNLLSEIKSLSKKIIKSWEFYHNESIQIIDNSNGENHNSSSIIVYKENNRYILNIIFRNNNTSLEKPHGIFHTSEQYFNIKSEGIGLIEASGLFILPPRLLRQIDLISNILVSKKYDKNELSKDMLVHHDFILNLLSKTKNDNLDKISGDTIIKNEINHICEKILIDTAVFKPDSHGHKHFKDFLKNNNITEVNH